MDILGLITGAFVIVYLGSFVYSRLDPKEKKCQIDIIDIEKLTISIVEIVSFLYIFNTSSNSPTLLLR